MTNSEHEHEHECSGGPDNGLYPGGLPTWRFSMWDVVGITLTGVGGVFSVVGQASNLLAREFSAMANFSRQEFDLRRAQQEYEEHQARMAEDLRAMLDAGEES